jgi:hypothetical protein
MSKTIIPFWGSKYDTKVAHNHGNPKAYQVEVILLIFAQGRVPFLLVSLPKSTTPKPRLTKGFRKIT